MGRRNAEMLNQAMTSGLAAISPRAPSRAAGSFNHPKMALKCGAEILSSAPAAPDPVQPFKSFCVDRESRLLHRLLRSHRCCRNQTQKPNFNRKCYASGYDGGAPGRPSLLQWPSRRLAWDQCTYRQFLL